MSEQQKFNEADCAYLAAVIDLRARVRIQREQRRNQTYRTLFLQLVDVPKPVADWIMERFGPARCVSRSEGVEITYVTLRAAEICVHAYPHLVAMKRVATLVTKFGSSIGPSRSPVSPEARAIREQVDRELQSIASGRGGRR